MFTYTIATSTPPVTAADGILVLVPWTEVKQSGLERALAFVAPDLRSLLLPFVGKHLAKPKANSRASFDLNANVRVCLQVCAKVSTFRRLEISRQALASLIGAKAKRILVDARAVGTEWIDPLVSAASVALYEVPTYRQETHKKEKAETRITFWVESSRKLEAENAAKAAELTADGTNLVRRLSLMAGNDLTTSRYVALATQIAKEAGLKTEFLPYAKLKTMGAGAFCAVAQGSPAKDAGVLKVHYQPKGASKKVAFVGKGITFDTGGANLKTEGHMLGMHGDMAGSAVALALVLWAAKSKAPFAASAYLAIADNQLTGDSYRPNDVVKSLSGKTIEVIDTDAEGRMVLADALTLASQDRPNFIVDFATLTGSCIRAIGTNYSGGYTNRRSLMQAIRTAGRDCGERVWAFPNDRDYGKGLKSKVADIMQCRHKGGVDHIEASYFLRQFVDKKIPYVHTDLSAIENEGGLAHVPTSHTGFGVRFGAALAEHVIGK